MYNTPFFAHVGYLSDRYASSHVMTLYLNEQTGQYFAIDPTKPLCRIPISDKPLKDKQFVKVPGHPVEWRINLY